MFRSGGYSRSAFPNSSGNRAMLTAMRLASSRVSTFACRASDSLSREAGWVGHGADCVAAELVARQRSDGWTPVASVRYGFRDDLGRKFDVSRRFRSARGDSDRLH
jgi:hypothetical protein